MNPYLYWPPATGSEDDQAAWDELVRWIDRNVEGFGEESS